jgi:hypothetical protein
MKCKTCGKNADSELCFKCKPRKPLSSGKGLNKSFGKGIYCQIREKGKHGVWESSKKMSVISSKKSYFDHNNGHNQQKEMFINIWKKKRHYSEVSGKYLGKEALSTYFHHILPKSKYPEACFDEENIVLLTPDEHASVELDCFKYKEINRRKELLKIKYGIN